MRVFGLSERSPSPFWVSGKAAGPTGPQIGGASYWRDTTAGTVRIDTPEGATPGLALRQIKTTSSSELGQLYGGQASRNFAGLFTINVSEGMWEKHVTGV